MLLECFDPDDLHRSSWDRKSPVGLTRKALETSDRILLAHGTSTTLADAIRSKGLQTHRGGAKPIADGLPTAPDFVYLNSKLDTHYLKRAIMEFGGDGLLVVVEAERSHLYGDENAVAPAELPGLTRMELLYRSLNLPFGACRHEGAIPPNQIRKMYRWNPNESNVLEAFRLMEA